MKHDEVRRINHQVCSAWYVKLPDGRKFLHLWTPNAEIEDVHYSCRQHYKEFTLGAITVGDFEVVVENQAYSSDGREVDQDWNIVLKGGK